MRLYNPLYTTLFQSLVYGSGEARTGAEVYLESLDESVLYYFYKFPTTMVDDSVVAAMQEITNPFQMKLNNVGGWTIQNFGDSLLQKVEINGDIDNIPNGLFYNSTELQSVTITSTVPITTIGNGAFQSTNLTNITFDCPSTVFPITLNAYAFNSTNLGNLTNFNKGVYYINDNCFDGANLTGDIDICCYQVRDNAFSNNDEITSLNLHLEEGYKYNETMNIDSLFVKSINSLTNLSSLTIKSYNRSTVTNFSNLSSLQKVVFDTNRIYFNEPNVFQNCPMVNEIHFLVDYASFPSSSRITSNQYGTCYISSTCQSINSIKSVFPTTWTFVLV